MYSVPAAACVTLPHNFTSTNIPCQFPFTVPLCSATGETLDSLEPKLEAMESELKDLNSKWEQLVVQRNR